MSVCKKIKITLLHTLILCGQIHLLVCLLVRFFFSAKILIWLICDSYSRTNCVRQIFRLKSVSDLLSRDAAMKTHGSVCFTFIH